MNPRLPPPSLWLLLLHLIGAVHTVGALPRLCDVVRVLREEQDQCLQELSKERTGDLDMVKPDPGCQGLWDNVSCWPSSRVGQTVEVQCPRFFQMLTSRSGSMFRNCTQGGWSEIFPRPDLACGVNVNDSSKETNQKRAGCKLVMVFFQYCIMANYAWLLVEGLYLHTLLVISFFSERKCLQRCVALGWGSPAIFVASWAITRHFLEDVGCWDINANASIWWVIRGPVILSILINFILFINILRILMRKLRTQETGRNEVNHYKRLAKSTLLLIPLFGAHYIIFAFSPEDAMEIQLFFELALGSFQGLVVAVLYCFLNGEVQLEIQKKWREWRLPEIPLCPLAFSNGTISHTHSTKASPSESSLGTCRASVI
ncbi:secretin receptor isoform X3 [Sturnira hondurensis]|uniref:secretin receptor isoform X3 n=1 Tax=Sturnira hondurensis TaxID=192404 RepID=UPI00187AAF4A|nr:secretin receptor isoform X3 [Sturnira hondurensis]